MAAQPSPASADQSCVSVWGCVWSRLLSCGRAQELGVMDRNTAGTPGTQRLYQGQSCSSVTFPCSDRVTAPRKQRCVPVLITGNSLSALGCWIAGSHYLTPCSVSAVTKEQELQQANPVWIILWMWILSNEVAARTGESQCQINTMYVPTNTKSKQTYPFRDSQGFQGTRDYWGWKSCFRDRQMEILLLCLHTLYSFSWA